jgi:ankyrin repeat protein
MRAGSLEYGEDAIDLLIRVGADLNARDSDGWNALFYTVLFGGNILSVRSLVQSGIKLEERDNYGSSVMLWAAAYLPDPVVLAYLTGQGASPCSRDKDGWTPLMAALNWGNEPAVVDFLSPYCLDGRIRDGTGRNLDSLKTIYEEKRGAAAPLSLEALTRRRVYSLDGLPARELNAALHELAEWGDSLSMAEELLNAGADILSTDNDRLTPLMKAAAYNRPALVRLLLEAGSPADYKNKFGWTALHTAAWSDYPETAELLLQAGAVVDSPDREGWTPLMWAARNQAPQETLQILLAAGAETGALSSSGETALFLMVSGWVAPRRENLILLLESVADLNRTNSKGVSALMKAAALGYKEAVELLMTGGADPSLKDLYGNRAMDYALSEGFQEIADILISY